MSEAFKEIKKITDEFYLGNTQLSEKGLEIMIMAYIYNSFCKSGKSFISPEAKALFLGE